MSAPGADQTGKSSIQKMARFGSNFSANQHAKSTFGLESLKPALNQGFYAVLPRESIVGVIIGDQLYNGEHTSDVLELLSRYESEMKMWFAEIDRTEFRVNLRPMRFA
jgi:hypothetical protein